MGYRDAHPYKENIVRFNGRPVLGEQLKVKEAFAVAKEATTIWQEVRNVEKRRIVYFVLPNMEAG